jgi:hypothetical protein
MLDHAKSSKRLLGAYSEEVCTLAGALFTALLSISGVRWTPGSGIVATCRMFDLDDFGSLWCQLIVRLPSSLRGHAVSVHTLDLRAFEYNMAAKHQQQYQA